MQVSQVYSAPQPPQNPNPLVRQLSLPPQSFPSNQPYVVSRRQSIQPIYMDPTQLAPPAPTPKPLAQGPNLNLVITPETSFHSVASQVLRQQQALSAFQEAPLQQINPPPAQQVVVAPTPAPQPTVHHIQPPQQSQLVAQTQQPAPTAPLQNQVLPRKTIHHRHSKPVFEILYSYRHLHYNSLIHSI